MKYICNDSGGLCSFWATYRTVKKHGSENVVRLFADTLIEDPELYEFMDQATGILGVPITRITKGITPWALFRKEGLIGNNRFPICSTKLKRELLDDWRDQNCLELQSQIIVGFDWTEEHRVKALRETMWRWDVQAPMTGEPIWDKCRMIKEAEALGMKIPLLYRLGFPHNNCGGRCVRAGISHWVHLYRTLPDRFIEWEDEEWECAADFRARGIEPWSILRDRRGGTTKTLYLRDLRARIEAGEKFSRFDWGGCGCGGATTAQNSPKIAPRADD